MEIRPNKIISKMEKVKVMIEWTGDNFSAGTGKINGVVMATGKTLEAVKKEFESAFRFHINGSLKDGDNLPDYILKGRYDLDFELGASAMLHLADGLISRSAISKATGINEKQLSHYITGEKVAREAQNKKIAAGIINISRQINELSGII
jgi:predicted RNase H-like HicB family nuclease